MSQKLNLRAVVEGVETQKDVETLQKIGFKHMQGYYFSHPLDTQKVTEILSNFNLLNVY
ncbi:MAG: EAL domain-containing protein [Leptolyngbya sp. SIOISBB]|nr:EAL domain-containing protein [Leptolyngbya sp. SIOISBB]